MNCKYESEFCRSHIHCSTCPHYEVGNIIIETCKTNAHKIRSMNDEELTEFLVDIGWDCTTCSEYKRLENEPLLRNQSCDEQCVKHCLEWLKEVN